MVGQGVRSFLGCETELKGTVYGGWGPQYAIPHLLDRCESGSLKPDELATTTDELDEINDTDDVPSGRIIRGVVTPSAAPELQTG